MSVQIMELYMSPSHDVVSSSASSLGYLDGSRALIEIHLVLRDPATLQEQSDSVLSQKPSARRQRKSAKANGLVGGPRKEVEISVKMQQNLNMLSQTSGDTGKSNLALRSDLS
jgi:hypothetical protein